MIGMYIVHEESSLERFTWKVVGFHKSAGGIICIMNSNYQRSHIRVESGQIPHWVESTLSRWLESKKFGI